MKKNNVMRVFSLLLALTLISVCAISGTFAKYVTKVEGQDQARVAKWGVVLTVSDESVFSTEYETDDATYKGEVSVQSSTKDKVVAPGTDNGEGIVATVFGTPEVATRYKLHIEGLKDIVLPAGTYTDYTQLVTKDKADIDVTDDDPAYGYYKTFTLGEDYSPVKWDIEVANSNGVSYKLTEVAAQFGKDFDGFSFTDAESIVTTESIMNQLLPVLDGMVEGGGDSKCVVNDDGTIDITMDFDPNIEMDYTFTLTWKWAFEQEDVELYDKADTYLGNWVANALGDTIEGFKAPTANNASYEISAKLTATATQID